MSKRSLKAAIEAGEFVIAPGLHDMIAAVTCNKGRLRFRLCVRLLDDGVGHTGFLMPA